MPPPYPSAPGRHAPRVVVVGAGIAGLAAAAELRVRAPHAEVVVLEAATTVGGKLALATVGGVRVDVGAEAILNRRPDGTDLVRSAGLGERLVHPARVSARLWSRNRLHVMPRTLMGVPADARALAESGVVSRHGLARAALDSVLPATRLEGTDVSVGGLVEERFGREVVDRLVEPLLGGVYAGHAREISVRAAVPQLLGLLERHRSLLRAAASVTGTPSDVPVFAGIEGGVGRLPDAVVAAFGLDVRVRSTVRELARRPEGGWNLVVGSAHEPEVVQADAVVLATPAGASARLLGDVAPAAALELARVEYASTAIVTMAFLAREVPEALREGSVSGFLVPPVDGRAIKAATYSFAKWEWVRRAGRGVGGAGRDVLVLRCSLGRHREEHVLQGTDTELVDRALADLCDATGVSVRPVDSHVQRWGGALPQYAVGHVERTATVRAEVGHRPGLAVCGAAYDGVGIPACVASGRRAAARVLDGLPAGGQ